MRAQAGMPKAPRTEVDWVLGSLRLYEPLTCIPHSPIVKNYRLHLEDFWFGVFSPALAVGELVGSFWPLRGGSIFP